MLKTVLEPPSDCGGLSAPLASLQPVCCNCDGSVLRPLFLLGRGDHVFLSRPLMVRVDDGALKRPRASVCSQRQMVSQGPDLLQSSVLLLRVGPAGVCGHSEVSLGAWVSRQAPLERLPPVWTPSPRLSLSGPYRLLAFLRRLGCSPRRDLPCRLLDASAPASSLQPD